MKWKDPVIPELGDKRQRLAFAWLPTKVEGYTVWLERYIVEEVYIRTFNSEFGPQHFWQASVRKPIQFHGCSQ